MNSPTYEVRVYGGKSYGRTYSFALLNLFMFMAQQSWIVIDRPERILP